MYYTTEEEILSEVKDIEFVLSEHKEQFDKMNRNLIEIQRSASNHKGSSICKNQEIIQIELGVIIILLAAIVCKMFLGKSTEK